MPKGPAVTRRSFLRGAAFGLAGSVLSASYADYSVHHPQLERVELHLKRWKADGLRVAFFSDIHVNDPDETARAHFASELLAATNPDLLLFGGDAINSKGDEPIKNIRECLKPFSHLKCPKIAVLGNHDYWTGMVDRIEGALEESGFLVLKNEVVTYANYAVAGYDDRIGGKRDPDFQPRHESLISLMHEPDDVDVVPASVSLQISGHSHGGQICLPFCIPLHTPRMARKYRRGYYPNAQVPLYVARGVGTVGPKWRLFCPPEITLLTLRSAP